MRDRLTKSSTPEPRVLLVEDSDINRRLATHHFSMMGFKVDAVSNGHDAIQAFLDHTYFMILMDCRLPGYPQFMTPRMIRLLESGATDGKRVPIIGLTAYSPPGFEQQCEQAGMDACFTKPVDRRTVDQIARTWASPAT